MLSNLKSWWNQRKARKNGKSSGHMDASERSAVFQKVKRLPKG